MRGGEKLKDQMSERFGSKYEIVFLSATAEDQTIVPSATARLQPNKFPIRTFKGSDKA